jgi:hypothetical protein
LPSSIINPQTNETLAPYQFDGGVTISGVNVSGSTTNASAGQLGLKAFNFAPLLASGSGTATTAQDLYLMQVNLSTATTFTNIYAYVAVALTAVPSTTASFAGIYQVTNSSTAVLVASTAQIGTTIGTTSGFKTFALTASYTTPNTGQFYVGVLMGTGSQPQFSTPSGGTAVTLAPTLAAGPVLTAANYPFALNGASLTTLPTTVTTTSNALTNALAIWVGLA